MRKSSESFDKQFKAVLMEQTLDHIVTDLDTKLHKSMQDMCVKYGVQERVVNEYVFNREGIRYKGIRNLLAYATRKASLPTSPQARTRLVDLLPAESAKGFAAEHDNMMVMVDMLRSDLNALSSYLRKVVVAAGNVEDVRQLLTNSALRNVVNDVVAVLVSRIVGIPDDYVSRSATLPEPVIERFHSQHAGKADILDRITTKVALFGL